MPARILEKPEAVDLRSVYLRLAGLEEESIVDGPGLRLTVFTQGCRHACPGCHNPAPMPWMAANCKALRKFWKFTAKTRFCAA